MLWKFYFWFVLALDLRAFIWPSSRRVWETIDTVFFVCALFGLFGYCWEKTMVARVFWQVFLFVFLAWIAFYIAIPAPMPSVLEFAARLRLPSQLVSAFSVVPYLPLIAALYLYAFKRPELWQSERGK